MSKSALFTHQAGPEDGPRVVLVHGSMDRNTSFARVGRHLRAFSVTRYDRRGYGRSLDAGVAGTLQEHVDDLLAVVGERPATVAGHSIGGTFALAAARQRPDLVVSVLGYEAPMQWQPWWPTDSAGGSAVRLGGPADPGDAAEAFARGMVGPRWDRLPARTRAERRREGPALVAELRAARRDGPLYDPAEIEVPVVAAHGSESVPHHVRSVQVLAEEAPSGELHVVDGAHHGAHLSHPRAFAALVERAVARSVG